MRVVHELLDLVLPASCVCCARAGPVWCGSCRPVSEPVPVPVPVGLPVVAAAEYAEELRTALLGYKERSLRALAAPLAGYLADAVDVACRTDPGGCPPLLAPVPSRRGAARRRGGDHLLRVARLAARESSLPLLPLLRLTGPVRDSAGLSVTERSANLAGRLAALPPGQPDPPPVIIVDDIVTSGATVAEASRALQAAGWPVRGAAVIAATRQRWPVAAAPATARQPLDWPAVQSLAASSSNDG